MNAVGTEHMDQVAGRWVSSTVMSAYSSLLMFYSRAAPPARLGRRLVSGELFGVGRDGFDSAGANDRHASRAYARARATFSSGLGRSDGGDPYRGGGGGLRLLVGSARHLAGVVMVLFAVLMGHEGTYRQYLAVVAHAHLISATSTVLLLPLRIAAEDAQLLLSLGVFAVFLESGYLLRVLSLLDLFGLWAWILVGLGASRIGRKESWVGAAVIVMVIPVTMAAVIAIFTG